jgi:hypothetical protein
MTTNSGKAGEPPPPIDDRAKAAVEKWLNNQGCRLEYRTYMAFRRHVVGTAGLGLYVQSEKGEPREIDVYTYWTAFSDNLDSGVHLRVICECKYSKGKPWVLMFAGPEKSFYITDWLHTPRSAALERPPKFSQPDVDELTKSFHFAEDAWLAHNIVQAHVDRENVVKRATKPRSGKGGMDYAYDALRKITYAAWDFVRTGESLGPKMYEMVFPCLVVDGPLFAAFFDRETEQFQATRIKYGRVCWQGCHNGTNVDVVCADFLDEYAKKVEESFVTVLPLFVAKFNINISVPDLDDIPRKAARRGRPQQ